MFSRSAMLVGEDGIERLAAAHVAVFGLGGVGSYAAEALARCGVGTLTLVDGDTVAPSNLNRQLYALRSTVGRPKVELASARIADINPSCRVTALERFYLPENAEEIFNPGWDYIIDAIDMVTAKIDLAVRASNSGVPMIASMGTGNKLDPTLLRVSDIYSTSVCPLCRVMRRELRVRRVGTLKAVWSPEEPIVPVCVPGDGGSRRSVPGSLTFVPSSAGILLAREAVMGIIRHTEDL